jgi:CheY-like chemotaxis protein
MVVDDSPQVLDAVSSLLATLDRAEIYKFRSGEEALNCFALYPHEFQLVITDLGLPRMSGIELCRRMQQISPSAKVILSTGSGPASEQAAKEAGCLAVLQKPFTASELWQLVKTVLPEKEDGDAAEDSTTPA